MRGLHSRVSTLYACFMYYIWILVIVIDAFSLVLLTRSGSRSEVRKTSDSKK